MFTQASGRAHLVDPHQARVAGYVRGQYRRQPSFDSRPDPCCRPLRLLTINGATAPSTPLAGFSFGSAPVGNSPHSVPRRRFELHPALTFDVLASRNRSYQAVDLSHTLPRMKL